MISSFCSLLPFINTLFTVGVGAREDDFSILRPLTIHQYTVHSRSESKRGWFQLGDPYIYNIRWSPIGDHQTGQGEYQIWKQQRKYTIKHLSALLQLHLHSQLNTCCTGNGSFPDGTKLSPDSMLMLSKWSCSLHNRAILYEMLKISFLEMNLKSYV